MKTTDGSIKDSDGKIIFFSFDRFMSDIVLGNCCFVCGVGPKEAAFNDEHVLPDWLLRKYRLHDKSVTLPNGTQFRYGGFTVPCCARCNALMGEQFENPISALFAKSRSARGGLLLRRPVAAISPLIPIGKEIERRSQEGEDISVLDNAGPVRYSRRKTTNTRPADAALIVRAKRFPKKLLRRRSGTSQHAIDRFFRGERVHPGTRKKLADAVVGLERERAR